MQRNDDLPLSAFERKMQADVEARQAKSRRDRWKWIFGLLGLVWFGHKLCSASAEDSARSARYRRERLETTPRAPPQDPDKPDKSYERMVAEAREEADRGNRQADDAMADMLNDYRRRSKSASTSSRGGVRIDTFVMKDGAIVVCGTTFRNNARATTCN